MNSCPRSTGADSSAPANNPPLPDRLRAEIAAQSTPDFDDIRHLPERIKRLPTHRQRELKLDALARYINVRKPTLESAIAGEKALPEEKLRALFQRVEYVEERHRECQSRRAQSDESASSFDLTAAITEGEVIAERGEDATAEAEPAPRANLEGFAVQAPKAPRIDIKDTAARALAAAEAICRHWLPEGKRQGHEWVSTNPTRTDKTPGSFSVNLDTGKWADFATDDKGGDLVSLVAYLESADSQVEAARTLAEWLGCAPVAETMPKPAKAAPRPMKARPPAHPKLGAPSAQWDYLDAEGRVLCAVMRFETASGKQFRPVTRTADGWIWKAPAEPRPLYGLDRLAARPEAPVIVAEGEKAADAAAVLLPDCVHIASMNGAQSPKKSDWTPLKGRVVRIWPDADRPGNDFAQTAARLILDAGAQSVEVLDLSNLGDGRPEGWDAADALADGWTPERFAQVARFVAWSADARRPIEQEREPEPPPFADDEIAERPSKSPDPYSNHGGTGGTGGTASNDAASSGSPTKKRRGTGGTDRAKPPVDRPGFAVHDDWTGYGKPGTYWHSTKEKGESLEDLDQWICSPLYADAITHGDRDADFGLLLRFKNALGREREWAMPMAMLRGSGEELRGELLTLGVRIDPASHRLLNQYLMGQYPKRCVVAATCTGWHGEGRAFVLPHRIIGEGEVRYQSEQADHDDFATGGTFDGWRAEIAARCSGNPMLILAVSAALAGPLLARVHRTGCGLHFYGDSSIGKSTLLALAASCWGGSGFIRTWRATSNGIEGTAAMLNDTTLILDEISEADPREVGAIVYSVGNGTGKSRAARTGGARAVKRWRVVLLSSGERTLIATMEEGGKRAKAGQEARLLDIPCTRQHGVFDVLHGFDGGRALTDTLKTSANLHHGHAGPAFIERLISDDRDYGETLAQIAALPEFAAETGVEGRTANTFTLIAMAGELAVEWGIAPWKEGEALDAAALAFRLWRDHRGKGQTETRQILQAVRDFISRHGDARFSPLHPLRDDGLEITVRDRAGWWKDREEGRVFLFTSAGLREASQGFDLRRVLDALDESGWIVERDEGKRSKKTKVQGHAQRLYAITPREDEAP
ncbi:DUF927 domain-containing protein [Allochromatium vinosum]|uniref:DUF927 domain-containing protein n=1 Tax=Allochromatium vinosum TaxID=1049 RepID=UPI001904085A|nr:DUF927 domain-containing protein [Allochromatium vinosum]MBK1656035.1 hypothetical protein [Allochromatium vinosum]